MTVLKDTVCQWRELGVQLRLRYFTLREIEKDRREAKECMIEMLAVWLKGQGGECTKHTLRTALCNINCRIVDKITVSDECIMIIQLIIYSLTIMIQQLLSLIHFLYVFLSIIEFKLVTTCYK